MSGPRTALHRGWIAALALAVWCAVSAPSQAANVYQIDQRFGRIDFAIGVLGLFSIDGHFPRFAGELQLDVDQPQQSSIDVTVETSALEMPVPEQVDLLRSEPYLDTARHPTARFVSRAVAPVSATQFAIHGVLTLRGVTHPLDLQARLEGRRRDEAGRTEVADFVVTGALRRSAFGMVADRPMLSDEVTLTIRIRLTIGAGPGGG
jgi:polyisoprenoid-binding protein YceI